MTAPLWPWTPGGGADGQHGSARPETTRTFRAASFLSHQVQIVGFAFGEAQVAHRWPLEQISRATQRYRRRRSA